MPARHGTDPLTSRPALRDNRRLLCVGPVAALASGSEYLKPLRPLAHRIVTRDYHRSSASTFNRARKLDASDQPCKVGPGHRLRLGEAIRYTLPRWDGLVRFLDDGRIDLDNNAVEHAIRPLALNRKNALFAGSDEGGNNWTVIATLIENCKLTGINPHTWLTATLTSLANGHPASRIEELLPHAHVA